MTSWHTYPKIYNLGHAAIAELLYDEVIVQEKLDGSQFSFGVFPLLDNPEVTELKIRSKSAQMHPDAPEKMFSKAVDYVRGVSGLLVPNWTYRAEYLAKPKHNALAYDRTPRNFLALFDINTGEEKYQPYETVWTEAERLGFEAVPCIVNGGLLPPGVEGLVLLRSYLDRVSFLGGQKIEGVVVKNYHRFGLDKKVLMGKFVSESFKEIHGGEWRAANPTNKDVVQQVIESLRTPARWAKAVQHLRELGLLENSPRDIGKIILEVQKDIEEEEGEAIKETMLKWVIGNVRRGVIRGLPEWYKDILLRKQFETKDQSARETI